MPRILHSKRVSSAVGSPYEDRVATGGCIDRQLDAQSSSPQDERCLVASPVPEQLRHDKSPNNTASSLNLSDKKEEEQEDQGI